MSKIYLDLALSIFFLIALVFVFNLRPQIQPRDKSTFAFMASGLTILAFMSLLTTFLNQLIENGAIGSAVTTYLGFARMALFVLGLVLITTAVARWLSMNKIQKSKVRDRGTENNSLYRILYEISKTGSVKEFLSTSLSLLSDVIPVEMAAVYAVNKSCNSATLMASESTINNTSLITPEIVFTPGWINGLTDTTLTFADEKMLSSQKYEGFNRYCFTATFSGRPRFVYVLYARKELRGRMEFSVPVAAITNGLRARLVAQTNMLKLRHNDDCRTLGNTLDEISKSSHSVNESVAAIKSEMSNHLAVAYFSITSVNGQGYGRRISVGESGTILNEIGVNVIRESGYLISSINNNKTKIINDMFELNPDLVPELLLKSSIKSALVIPISARNGMKGAVTIGANSFDSYRTIDMEMAESGLTAFERILDQISLEEETERVVGSESALQRFVSDIALADSEKDVFDAAVKMLHKIVGCRFIRIATTDTSRNFINSRAIINHTGHKALVPGDGRLILSVLPWHKVAVSNGNTIIVNSGYGQDKMTEIESKQVFAGSTSGAIIIPIKFGDSVYGTVSLAESGFNKGSIITSDRIQFVETVAAVLAVYLDATFRGRDKLAEFATSAKSEIIDSFRNKHLRTRVRSSLASIIGSLDMLKKGDVNNEVKGNKFFTIIDKSAQKLEELVKK